MSFAKELTSVWSLLSDHPLTHSRPSAALGRFLRWQIAARTYGASALVPFVDSSRLIVRRGMTGATGNLYVGLMEFADMGFVLHFLEDDDLFGDIGANVGVYTILASAVRRARSLAVEPVAASAAALLDNVRLNDVSERVALHQVAVGDVEGQVTFTADLDTTNHVLASSEQHSGNTIEVPLTTIDSLFDKTPPALMKVDVEGYEWPLLIGGRKTLSHPACQALIMETNGSGSRYGIPDSSIDEMVRGFGFAPFTYDPLTRELTELASFGPKNTIYIKDLENVRGRINRARAFRVLDRSI